MGHCGVAQAIRRVSPIQRVAPAAGGGLAHRRGSLQVKKSLARTFLAGAAAGLIAFAVAAAAPGAGNAGRSLNTFGWASHLTTGQVRALSASADQRVIVLLRNQHTALGSAEARRGQAFATDRAPIVAQLRQLHAPRIVT